MRNSSETKQRDSSPPPANTRHRQAIDHRSSSHNSFALLAIDTTAADRTPQARIQSTSSSRLRQVRWLDQVVVQVWLIVVLPVELDLYHVHRLACVRRIRPPSCKDAPLAPSPTARSLPTASATRMRTMAAMTAAVPPASAVVGCVLDMNTPTDSVTRIPAAG